MTEIYATTIDSADVPVLSVSGGAGNTQHATEVHLNLKDPVSGIGVQGWFRLAEIETALFAARQVSAARLPARVREPVIVRGEK